MILECQDGPRWQESSAQQTVAVHGEDDADAKVRFLAAEALRGVGGIILNRDGERFVNELGRRDYVTRKAWENKPGMF